MKAIKKVEVLSMDFSVPGEPKGKARARTVRLQSGKTTTYTPEQTVLYENLVKTCFIEANKAYKKPCIEGALQMWIWAHFPVPKSASKKKKEMMLKGDIRPTKKPDMDNIIKVICDALNGLAYKDDSQVVSISCDKYYSERPRVDVEICEL